MRIAYWVDNKTLAYRDATPEEIAEIESQQPPTPELTPEERITALEAENTKLAAQNDALTQTTEMLEECIIEMAQAVYA